MTNERACVVLVDGGCRLPAPRLRYEPRRRRERRRLWNKRIGRLGYELRRLFIGVDVRLGVQFGLEQRRVDFHERIGLVLQRQLGINLQRLGLVLRW
jgi:hypothetical protein